MSIQQVVLSGECAPHTPFVWSTCCSNQQSPNEARFRDGSFDRWYDDQGISVEWKMRHACALSKIVESQVVCEIHRRMTKCPEYCGGTQWRRQDTVRKCFVNSTEVSPPSQLLEKS